MHIYIPTRDNRILIQLYRYLLGHKVSFISSLTLPNARNLMIKNALKEKDHIIMLDDDVLPLFKLDDFVNVAEQYFKEYDVVCGAYYLKTLAGISVGVFAENAHKFGLFANNSDVVWFPRPTVVDVQVDVCGTGLIAINYNFIERIKNNYPWFKEVVDENGILKMGEDVYFFKKFKPKAIFAHKFVAKHYLDSFRYITIEGFLGIDGKPIDNDEISQP